MRGSLLAPDTVASQAGYAAEAAPRCVLPTVVGSARSKGLVVATGTPEHYVGHAAEDRRGLLTMSRPDGAAHAALAPFASIECRTRRVRNGLVEDWQAMEQLWSHLFFNQLQVACQDMPVLLAMPHHTPREGSAATARATWFILRPHPCAAPSILPSGACPLTQPHPLRRAKAAEILFEKFSLPALHMQDSSTLALYSTGQTNGLVVDSGLHVTSAVPVFEGFAVRRHAVKSCIAGHSLDRYLHTQLDSRGFSFTTPAELDMVREVKELKGFVSEDYAAALDEAQVVSQGKKAFQAGYMLPDGTEVELNEERFRTPELLFNPALWDAASEDVLDKDGVTVFSALGLHQIAFRAIENVDGDLRPEMYRHVVMAGGTCMFQGMAGRLYNELQAQYRSEYPNEVAVTTNVTCSPDAMYATWLGGSMFGALPTLSSMMVPPVAFVPVAT
eukprot:gene4367-793_t